MFRVRAAASFRLFRYRRRRRRRRRLPVVQKKSHMFVVKSCHLQKNYRSSIFQPRRRFVENRYLCLSFTLHSETKIDFTRSILSTAMSCSTPPILAQNGSAIEKSGPGSV